MSSYEQYHPSILPAWLQGVNGLAYAGVLGALKDEISNAARAAAVVGMPYGGPTDALPAIGYERGLPRYQSETQSQYSGRLRLAWDAWERAGTPLGMLLQLEVIYPRIPIVLVQQAGRAFYLNPDTSLPASDRLVIVTLPHGGWRFDSNGGLPLAQGFWSRFGVIFPGPLPVTWTSVQSPPGPATAPDTAEVNTIIALVNKWKPAKATAMWIKVMRGRQLWGWPPGRKWGDSGLKWGGGSPSVTWNTTGY